MPLASHEVRWFFNGELDESGEVYSWFTRPDWLRETPIAADFKWPGLEAREDIYCVLSQKGDLGLKWRSDEKGDSLDIKGRTAELGTIQFGSNAMGKVERWIKWQYNNTEVPESVRDVFDVTRQKGNLVRIKKNRILRKVRLDAFGNDEEVTTKTPIDRGLNIELTKLVINGSDACWTLGFEAFPHDEGLHGAFHRNVSLFLEGYSGQSLNFNKSMSYAEWLVVRAATGVDSVSNNS